MNRKQFCRILICTAVVFAVPPAAWADDVAPPPYRGLPNSVMAKFDLFGGAAPGPAANFTTGAGATYPLSTVAPEVGTPQTGPNNSILYPIGLPNYIDQLPIKYIRVQYSWFSGAPTGGPVGDAQTLNVFPSPGGAVNLVGSSPPMLLTGNIYHRWDDYEIRPNPDSEQFEIAFFEADPRWVIIDTISIPEPATRLLALAGIAGCVMAVRRRR